MCPLSLTHTHHQPTLFVIKSFGDSIMSEEKKVKKVRKKNQTQRWVTTRSPEWARIRISMTICRRIDLWLYRIVVLWVSQWRSGYRLIWKRSLGRLGNSRWNEAKRRRTFWFFLSLGIIRWHEHTHTHRFRYFDQTKNAAKYKFKKPNDTINLSFKEFLSKSVDKDDKYSYYLQENLGQHAELSEDFKEWDWNWILNYVRKQKWGLPERNLLLVGTKEATTPCHYDEQQNMYCQIGGT